MTKVALHKDVFSRNSWGMYGRSGVLAACSGYEQCLLTLPRPVYPTMLLNLHTTVKLIAATLIDLRESHTECSWLGLGQGSVGNPFPCSPSPTMVFCCLLLSSFFLSADLCSSPRCFRSTALLTVASLAQRDHWAGPGFSVSVLWLQKDILYISRQRALWLLGYLSQELQYSVAYYPIPENSSLRDFVQFLLVSGREVNLVPVNPA